MLGVLFARANRQQSFPEEESVDRPVTMSSLRSMVRGEQLAIVKESKNDDNSSISSSKNDEVAVEMSCRSSFREKVPSVKRRRRSFLARYRNLILVVGYYAAGCFCFCLGPEKWTIIESLYFLSVTFTTVGYGDITPKFASSRLAGVVFIFVGLVIVFPVLADLAVWLLRRVERHMDTWTPAITKEAIERQHNMKLAFSISLILLPIFVGIIFFYVVQVQLGNWNFVEALWWTISTVTTVGYGDLTYGRENVQRLFLTFFIPLSTVLAGAAIANLANARTDRKRALKEQHLLETFDADLLLKFDSSGDNQVDKSEYILGMLQCKK